MSNGHPNLPQGMVLPEGWTLMPLNRQEGTAPAAIPTAVNAQPNAPEASTVETPAHAQSSIIPTYCVRSHFTPSHRTFSWTDRRERLTPVCTHCPRRQSTNPTRNPVSNTHTNTKSRQHIGKSLSRARKHSLDLRQLGFQRANSHGARSV
jgi:hypothetical protein